MTRVYARIVLPSLLLLTTAACGPRAEPPPREDTGVTAPATDPAPVGTEGAVVPAEPDAPPPVSQVAPAPTTSGRPVAPPVGPPSRATAPVNAPANAPAAPRGSALPPRSGGDAPAPELPDRDVSRETSPAPEAAARPVPVRMVSVPAETTLKITLLDSVASDTSAVEDRVAGRLANDVTVAGETVIPAGSRLGGVVTYVQESAKVKGRAALTVRFRTLTIGSRTYDLVAEPVRREAAGTKARDARDIGIGAGAGAVIGGLIGGRKGAGIGAAVGGAGGAGKVLASRGEEVRVPSGTVLSTRLESPLTVEISPERQ